MKGQPRAFKTIQEAETYSNNFDENIEEQIYIKSIESICNNDFGNEKELVEHIVINIDKFAKDILDDEVISFEVEKQLSAKGRRIDLYIIGKNKTYIIEFKNPKCSTEIRASIGQLLDYGREFTDPKKELILISTKYDYNTQATISYYNLPIRYIYISKSIYLEAIK